MNPIRVAVIDTGVNPNQVKVLPGLNLAEDDYGTHGTEIAQTILSIAPEAEIVPIQIVNAQGILRNPEAMTIALNWILENHDRLNIRVVCAAISDTTRSQSDEYYAEHPLRPVIAHLKKRGIATVAAAGNWYANHHVQGMAFPAILREVISVGAVTKTANGFQLAPISQRLHSTLETGCYTTFFVEPGAPGDTSGATAIVAGYFANLARLQPEKTVDEWIQALDEFCQVIQDENHLAWKILPQHHISTSYPPFE